MILFFFQSVCLEWAGKYNTVLVVWSTLIIFWNMGYTEMKMSYGDFIIGLGIWGEWEISKN